MLFCKSGCDPNYCYGLEARRICQKLTKMAVVGSLQLILYENPSARSNIFAEDISTERPYRFLLRLNFQV